jgi:hypothetical protein
MFYLIAQAASEAGSSGAGTGGVAEQSALVTCSGLDCTVCSLVQMVVNLFYYLTWYIAFPVAVLFLIIGGFIYIGSRGNENWMSFAKRGIMYTVGGFGVSVLAFLAINTLVQVVGGTGSGIWSKFECGSGSTASTKNIPTVRTADLLKAEKSGGQLAGRLANNTNANDILELMDKLDSSDMIIFESDLNGTRKALMAVGKKNSQPELLYVDRSTINAILQSKKTSLLINEAAADTNVDAAIKELVNEISQIVARIIASKHDLFVVVTGKPEAGSVTAVLGAVSKVEQCVSTNGTWFSFPNICTAEQQSCDTVKCTPSGSNLVASCKCPDSKCLSGGQCVNKTNKK